MSDPLRPFTRLRTIMLGLVTTVAFLAGLLTPETSPVTAPHWLFAAMLGVVLLSGLLDPWIAEFLEFFRPLRPVESSVVLYSMLAAFFVYALFFEPTKHFPDIMLLMMVVHLVLVPLAASGQGRAMVLVNSLFIVLEVAVAAPNDAMPWCMAYMLVTVVTLVVHHHTQRLTSYALPRAVKIGPMIWQAIWTSTVLILLASVILPFFPDLRANLTLRIPTGARREVDALDILVMLVVLLVLTIILVRLLRKLLITVNAPPRPVPEEEVEELFADPEPVDLVTRRTRFRLWRSVRERIVDEYCWLLARLSSEGYPRPAFQTGEEYGRRVAGYQPATEKPLSSLTELFYRARYSDLPIERADLLEAHRLVREVLLTLTEDS